MQKQVFIFLFCLIGLTGFNQPKKELVILSITNYITKANDSITIVQVKLPKQSKITIAEKTLGMLLHKYDAKDGLDTSKIGYGRCQLIKGDYYYFGIKHDVAKKIIGNELLHLKTEVNILYTGLLAKLSLLNVQFANVYDSLFYTIEAPYSFISDNEEGEYFDKMVEDIKFTANAMLAQMPKSNTMLTDGRYKGSKLFDKMRTITASDLVLFLEYILARPNKYKGHTWKISEIFATWLVGGAPEVIK